MKLISRADAIEEGLEAYFTGKPCKRGHLSERRTTTAACIECVNTRLAYIIERQQARKKRLAEAAQTADVAA
jgi:hypothetical protein